MNGITQQKYSARVFPSAVIKNKNKSHHHHHCIMFSSSSSLPSSTNNNSNSNRTLQARKKFRWGSEQGRQVLTHVFTFLTLHDVPSIRLTSVAWWRASHAREIWMSIASSLMKTSSSSSSSSSVFGVRDVESVLKEVLKIRNQQQQNHAKPQQQDTHHQHHHEQLQTEEQEIPSWIPHGQTPSWMPQPPPRRRSIPPPSQQQQSNSADDLQQQQQQQQQRASDQIHFREITQHRQQQREAEAHNTTINIDNNNNTNNNDDSTIISLKDQLDQIAIQVLAKLRVPVNTPHSNLMPWQRGELIETQINALRYRAKQLVSSVVSEDENDAPSIPSATSSRQQRQQQQKVDGRVDLLERRQKETKQLAINTKIENENVETLVKESRRTFKVIELQDAQRNLVTEFEKKVVRLCTKFSIAELPTKNNSNGKNTNSISRSNSIADSQHQHLATFFDLEMACLSPARIGTRLYTNWSAMKRSIPIDDIYFEAVDVLLSSSNFSNLSAVEHVVASDEVHHQEADQQDSVEGEEISSSYFNTITTRRDFLKLLRKSCIECLKRSSSSSIGEETHGMIVDVMIAFVYSAKMTIDGSFSEEMKMQADGSNVNDVAQPMTPTFDPKNWKDVLDSVDRAKHYATALVCL